jgi:hypothetical protein
MAVVSVAGTAALGAAFVLSLTGCGDAARPADTSPAKSSAAPNADGCPDPTAISDPLGLHVPRLHDDRIGGPQQVTFCIYNDRGSASGRPPSITLTVLRAAQPAKSVPDNKPAPGIRDGLYGVTNSGNRHGWKRTGATCHAPGGGGLSFYALSLKPFKDSQTLAAMHAVCAA